MTATDTAEDSLRRFAAIRLFTQRQGDQLWPGLAKAPFDILLVEPAGERLLCREPLPSGFSRAARDPISGCSSGRRGRSALPNGLLAAMPVFGPPSTIVMGTPEATGRSTADWTRTILHEHFHQWQDSLPGFYARVAALDLSGGDQTGMWMLNYPFPYADAAANAAMADAAKALSLALDARGKRELRASFARYLVARARLAKSVGSRNWRYAEFELWKEGVARWTEVELGKRFPDPKVHASALELERRTRAWLARPDLANAGREFVYPYGAAEAMLLQRCGERWRRAYPAQLALGPMLDAARRTCGR